MVESALWAKTIRISKPLHGAFSQIEGAMKRLLAVPKEELDKRVREFKKRGRAWQEIEEKAFLTSPTIFPDPEIHG